MLVIGGGIHGVGVAQAAAAAGYEVVLLEQTSLAVGTSSRSSKLIHGGLRYLESAEFSLVRESLKERELLLKLAPGLVKRQKFYIPVYPDTSRRPWQMRLGLSAYAVLAGMGTYARYQTVPEKDWPALDGLETKGLQKVFQYWDAQTDDKLLTRAVMRSAQQLGAELMCPAQFRSGQITGQGCEVTYAADNEIVECTARVVVNAAGPWAHSVADKFSPGVPGFAVDTVQGTHLELPGKVAAGCYYLEVPTDQRAVFVMPWKGDTTLLGTTETLYRGDPAAVKPLPQEKEYLLRVYAHYFPGRSRDIIDEWAGLRVLPAAIDKAFKRSREIHLSVDNEARPRVLSIFGGKLTGYRATAQQVMNVLRRTLPPAEARADTRELPLDAAEQ